VAITGRSGSGKSTFLHLAAGIDRPSRGTITALGHDLARLSDRALASYRRDTVGLIFQFFHLLPHLSVRENVALPAWIAGDRPWQCAARVEAVRGAGRGASRSGRPGSARRRRRAETERRGDAAGGDLPGSAAPAAPPAGRRADRQPG
jgi:ABC-type lipoprotein export system ATPase subunit